MKKISLLLFLTVFSSCLLTSCGPIAREAVERYEKDKYVYLVAGFDEAAENTDVLFTVSYDADSGICRVAQIPRDTYYNFGKSQNKINQVYATEINNGRSAGEALANTAGKIASLFGTAFDGYVGISIECFKKMVDAVGGLDVNLPSDMTLYFDSDEQPLVLKKGINHIDGEAAELFVRFRKGYAMGDLGRIDAQKIFLHSLFSKLSQGMSLPEILRIATAFQNEVVTNIKVSDAITVFAKAMSSEADKQIFYATVPGEPVTNANGLSFYVLNRKSAAELASCYMFATDEFDKDRNCLNTAEAGFVNVYEDDSISYREYSGESVSNMHIISVG